MLYFTKEPLIHSGGHALTDLKINSEHLKEHISRWPARFMIKTSQLSMVHCIAFISALLHHKHSRVFSPSSHTQMDSQCPFIAEELTCLVCHTVLKDPVLSSCSHNVCKVCFDQAWNSMGSLYGVSACSASRCGLHREKFTLFCLNDEEVLCEACRASKTHENHKCCSVDIAARDYKVSDSDYRNIIYVSLKIL